MTDQDVYEVIQNDQKFSVLAEILESTGIGEALANEKNAFTFFAPTDDALSHLSKSALQLLKSPEGKDLALAILGRHVIPGSYLYSDDLRRSKSLTPLNGPNIKVSIKNNAVRFGGAPIKTPGIAARNGVVFPVDRVQPLRKHVRGA